MIRDRDSSTGKAGPLDSPRGMALVGRVISVLRSAPTASARISLFWLVCLPLSFPGGGAAQETEEIRARMEYDRLRFFSGGRRVDAARRLQMARQRILAMRRTGIWPDIALDARWRALGPDQVDSYGYRTAGRVSAIAIHPHDANILYAGGAQGGVWRSDDRGASWTPLTDDECSLAMGSIAIDPVNPDIVYAGTGEQHFSGDSYYGCGVLRSLDGGDSWEQLGGEEFVSREFGGGAKISRVIVDRATAGSASSTTVLAATSFGLFRSTSSGRSWTEVLDGTATDLVVHPTNPAILYAAVGGDGVYKSFDTGASWRRTSSGLRDRDVFRINLAISPSSPDVLYAAMVNYGEDRSEGRGLLLYRTGNGAQSWTRAAANGADCGYQCWYDMTLAAHPEDPDNLFFGGVVLFMSRDGGQTFSDRHPPGVYVDQHLMVFDTLSGNDVLYVANDGGVYRSDDAGASYTSLATNLAVAQFYPGIANHPSDPAVTLGGTQDQGTQRSAAGTKVWTKVLGGDGGFTAFDSEDPDVWYAETQWSSGSGYSGPRKNGGLALNGIDRDEYGLFIPPLVMDEVDSKRLYFGLQSLYRTDDAAERWTRIFKSDRGVVAAIAPSPADGKTVYASLTSGRVVATHDGGETWRVSGNAEGLPYRFIADLAAHPADPDQAYAVTGGFLAGHVFQTTDGGRTWRDRTGNLPDLPVNAVLYDPADPGGVLVGTDLGVFYSPRGGDSWERLGEGFPMVAVFDLAALPGTGRLVAATHGRGMFEIAVRVPLTARVRPTTVADTVGCAGEPPPGGRVIVAPRGQDDHRAGWSVTAGAPWITLEGAMGEGRGRFRYGFSEEGLPPGDHSNSITVTVAGVARPVTIPVEVRRVSARSLALAAGGRTHSVLVGSEEPFTDSVAVAFSGPGGADAEWTVAYGGGKWLEVATKEGKGSGTVTWTLDPSGLGKGLHIETIVVTSRCAAGSPARFVDTLSVEPPLSIRASSLTIGYGMTGLSTAPGDSLPAGFAGFGANSAVWIAESAGSGWLGLERTRGSGSDRIVWTRSAESLAPGTHQDTIRIRVEGHPDLSGMIVDRFLVAEETSVEDAVHHLLGSDRLDLVQRLFLDWFGNRDGTFNAGDVLRWIDHCAGSGRAGCAGGEAPRAARGALERLRPILPMNWPWRRP